MPLPDRRRPEALIETPIVTLDAPRMAAAALAVLVMLLGLLVMVGWALHAEILTQILSQWNAMQPMTAMAFIFAGAGLLPWRQRWRPVRAALLVAVAGIAAAALVQSALGLNLGIDTALFPRAVAVQALRFPGRPSEVSAILFLLFDICLVLVDRDEHGLALNWLATIGLLVATGGMVSYLFGAGGLADLGAYASMAAHTAAGFLLLFLGVLLRRVDQTWLRTTLSPLAGGQITRRIVPAVLGIPLLVGLAVSYWGGLWDTRGAARIAVCMVLVAAALVALTLRIARFLDVADERRNAAEAARRESEARFRTVFEQAAIGIERISLEGRFLEANAKACDLLGYSREEVLALSIFDVTDPLDLAEEHRLVAEMQAGKRDSFVIEKRRRRKDGSQIWVRVTSSIPRTVNQLPYRISVVEDITDRKEMVRQLQSAKDAAERASRDKSRFLASASHDLRQPVQAIVLMTTVMAGHLAGHPAAKLLADMGKAVDALRTLLGGLLDVSRLDAGVVEAQAQDVPLADLIERLAAEYHLQAEQKGLSLRTVPCNAVVHTDPALLERILRNLVENAMRYSEHGGILIGTRRRGTKVAMQVVDTGIGIAPAEQEMIFQEFYQVENPERDRTKGLGLGLAIVQRLARLLGLTVTLASVPGRGSCFSVEIPVCGHQVRRFAPLPLREDGTCVGTILVIDDEPLVRSSLDVLLQSWGCTVVAAEDAREAVAWVTAQGRCPDMILADYRLRDGHTGTNAVREVQLACGTKVPAVIITGDTSAERILEATRSGFEIAHKPVAPDRLRQLVMATGR